MKIKRLGYAKGIEIHKKDLKTGAESHLTIGEIEVTIKIAECAYCGYNLTPEQKICSQCGAPA